MGGLLLVEKSIWEWISELVSAPRAQINTFALLVMTHLQPSDQLIFETAGLHERLLVLCSPEADPDSRYHASKLLLTAHRAGTRPAPQQPSLAHLCSCLAINFQASLKTDLALQDVLGTEVDKSCNWSSVTSNVAGDLMEQVCENSSLFRSEVDEWRASVAAAGECTDRALERHSQAGAGLHEYGHTLNAAE